VEEFAGDACVAGMAGAGGGVSVGVAASFAEDASGGEVVCDGVFEGEEVVVWISGLCGGVIMVAP